MITKIDNLRVRERIRQEAETFNQLKKHDRQWFRLRLVMGYSSIFMLLAILGMTSRIIFNTENFPQKVVDLAGPALFVDILSLIFTVWKVVLNPNFATKLNPTTSS